MVAGDVEVRIIDAVATTIDSNLEAMRATAGANGTYMAVSTGPENQQIILIAITE